MSALPIQSESSVSPTEADELHPLIIIHELRSRRYHVLKPQSHAPLYLVQTAIRSFNSLTLTPYQLEALRQLRLALEQCPSICRESKDGVPPVDVMLALIGHISDIFFLGSLKEVRFEWSSSGRYDYDAPYYCYGSAGLSEEGYIEIIMCLPYAQDFLSDFLRGQGHVFGTLLHECVHAFLITYCCSSYLRECEDEVCRARHIEHTGTTNHGSSWVELAGSVELAARLRLDIEMDLGIDESILVEEDERWMYRESNLPTFRLLDLLRIPKRQARN